MPEITVDKHAETIARKDYVRFAGEAGVVLTVAKAAPEKLAS
jgi:hypothetical protein